MPVILPEHLFPWLLKHKEESFPTTEEVSEYWHHMAQRPIHWVRHVIESGAMSIPIWLWGDDAVFNERNEKILSVCCGSFLENRTNSKDTVYPLFTYRLETRIIVHSLFFYPLNLTFVESCGSMLFESITLDLHQHSLGQLPWIRDTPGVLETSCLVASNPGCSQPKSDPTKTWGGAIFQSPFRWYCCPWSYPYISKPNHSLHSNRFFGRLEMASRCFVSIQFNMFVVQKTLVW